MMGIRAVTSIASCGAATSATAAGHPEDVTNASGI